MKSVMQDIYLGRNPVFWFSFDTE